MFVTIIIVSRCLKVLSHYTEILGRRGFFSVCFQNVKVKNRKVSPYRWDGPDIASLAMLKVSRVILLNYAMMLMYMPVAF